MLTVKLCKRCQTLREVSNFGRNKARTDGLFIWCKFCVSEENARRADAKKRWALDNAEKLAEFGREYRKKNSARIVARVTRWRHANPNQPAQNARTAKYRATKRQATPKWSDLKAIESMYQIAALLTTVTGVRHDVDHIVPLKSKIVCGLHCEANLQILTSSENKRKLNVYWPDMP